MADTPARMIRNTTRSMMMTVDRSGSSLVTSLLPFMFLRTGRWLRLMRFSGSTKSFSVREAARSCAAYDLFCSIVKVFTSCSPFTLSIHVFFSLCGRDFHKGSSQE